MKTATLYIENLKCHGCANTIKREINKMPETTAVSLNFEESKIAIEYDSKEDMLEIFQQKLAKLGYPVRGKKNLANTAKSYVSCAIGRMHKE